MTFFHPLLLFSPPSPVVHKIGRNKTSSRALSVPMSPTAVPILIFLSLSSPAFFSVGVAGDALTAYELLQQYHFPGGLLPKGVIGYDFDASTGKFSVYLNGTCSFSLEDSYQIRYRPSISGSISNDRMTDLSGVSVKVLFFWLNIVEVVRSGDEIQMSVGIASATFPADNFSECPQCGCGMDCDYQQVM